MALSDCPKCWDTPCTCGHMGYRVSYPYNVDENPIAYKFSKENQKLREEKLELEKLVRRQKEVIHLLDTAVLGSSGAIKILYRKERPTMIALCNVVLDNNDEARRQKALL